MLRRLDTYIEPRHALARRYAAALADSGLQLPLTAPGNRHVYYLYVVRHADHPEESLPETERAVREILSLPMYPSLTDAEQDRVCGALHAILPV